LEYRSPSDAESWAEQVKALYDQGILYKAIACQLGIGRTLRRRALEVWYEQRGLELPADARPQDH
jgi:hypothetical protein